MKRIILFFAVCLGLSVSQTTLADNAETVRAASKRTPTTSMSANTNSSQKTNRSVPTTVRKTESTQNKSARNTVKASQQRVVNRTNTTNQPTVKQRAVSVQTNTQPKQISTKPRNSATRVVEARKIESVKPKTTRVATTKKAVQRKTRTAELDSEKINTIKSKDYSKCKTVFFECMDEFCANKDTNLRRCACSSRIHEFDAIKKQLSNAEDKMLDFNQSLLTVSLDKEDAAAINVASEGEIAYDKKDKSESEKLLQKITNTLNSSGNSRFDNNLSAISLSLDMDTAWDSIDSLGGISTTAKNGLGLYNAARPVCFEMAKEVCSDDELNIVEGSYKLTIQQDCETVSKSYNTLYNEAQGKIYESGALLEMSRLNIYQQRNSDDILTCKKKILTQLSDASVCGESLYKCLDTTGQYINPSTGKAFLSENLYNLVSLLQEPTGDEKWSKIGQNEKFVKFLNSKKAFLEPATEQCQDIADTVWKEFLDDALAKIKLAQNAKMEEIRQSCTTLIAECKSNALTDLSEFDARALSTFSVAADKTVNAMCSDIEVSCVALMNNVDTSEQWKEGIAGIASDISYENLIETCTQVGRDCIVQQCNGTSGNFALCKKATDDRRMAILKRDACWDEVLNCVKSADNLANMSSTYQEPTSNQNPHPYYETTACNGDMACLITKQIWGDCDYNPTQYDIVGYIENNDKQQTNNKITSSESTLLSWLATNTGTADALDNCNASGCLLNYVHDSDNRCKKQPTSCLAYYTGEDNTNGFIIDPLTNNNNSTCILNSNQIIYPASDIKNYCAGGVLDVYGNCCASKTRSNGICVPGDGYTADFLHTVQCDDSVTTNNNDPEYTYMCPQDSSVPRTFGVYCIHTDTYGITVTSLSNSTSIYCANGFWMLIDQYGNYMPPYGNTTNVPKMSYYYNTENGKCETSYHCTSEDTCSNSWIGSCDTDMLSVPTTNEFIISY